MLLAGDTANAKVEYSAKSGLLPSQSALSWASIPKFETTTQRGAFLGVSFKSSTLQWNLLIVLMRLNFYNVRARLEGGLSLIFSTLRLVYAESLRPKDILVWLYGGDIRC